MPTSNAAASTAAATPGTTPYVPQRPDRSLYLDIRGVRHHVRCWDPAVSVAGAPPTLFLLHGWMDMSASFQFVVDALPPHWRLYAPDWRGFGLTERTGSDTYWFPDYLGDLDGLLDRLSPDAPADIVAHSMGGNVAAIYAGVRPTRIARLVNLEGPGLPASEPSQAPLRYARWLDELKAPPALRGYASLAEVAARLMRANPRLRAGQAAFLARHAARATAAGRFEWYADPAHRLVSAMLYRVEEVVACWSAITADVLWVQAGYADEWQRFIDTPEYRRRLSVIRSLTRVTVAGAGHMLHHDRPAEVARLIEEFLA